MSSRRAFPRPSWGWQDAANCRGQDLELFFGPEGERGEARENREWRAKQVCFGCPVRAACLDDALARRDWHSSIWGGLNGEERLAEHRWRLRNARAA